VHLMNFISAVFSLLISLCFNVQISQPYKSYGTDKTLYQDCLWIKFNSKTLFSIHNLLKIYLLLKLCPFLLHMKFYIHYMNIFTCCNIAYQLQLSFWLEPVIYMPLLYILADIYSFQTWK
jgi:hypothetical protein